MSSFPTMSNQTLREVGEKEGIGVEYDDNNDTVTISKDNKAITFPSGQGSEYGMGGLKDGYNMVSDVQKLKNSFLTPDNRYQISATRTDNSGIINNTMDSVYNNQSNLLTAAYNRKKNEINSKLSQVPEIYKQVRNNLSVTNESGKKQMEEHIANTGNHTASGYALSKRQNNQNAYNKEINAANIAEEQSKAAYESELRDAAYKLQADKATLSDSINSQRLSMLLDESNKSAEFAFNRDKANQDNLYKNDTLNETKRMNDVDIYSTYKKLEYEDEANKRANDANKRDEDSNIRAQQKHDTEMLSYEDRLWAELNSVLAGTANTNARTENVTADTALKQLELEYAPLEKDADIAYKNAQTAKISATPIKAAKSTSSSSSSSSASKASSTSKSTATTTKTNNQLAKEIKEQAMMSKLTPKGEIVEEMDSWRAYVLLYEWRQKYNLDDTRLLDIANILGISDKL